MPVSVNGGGVPVTPTSSVSGGSGADSVTLMSRTWKIQQQPEMDDALVSECLSREREVATYDTNVAKYSTLLQGITVEWTPELEALPVRETSYINPNYRRREGADPQKEWPYEEDVHAD